MNEKEIKEQLLGKNTLIISGEVDSDMLYYVQKSIIELMCRGNPPLKVIITSNGGDVTCGLHIHDALAHYPNTIEGTVIDRARSMGAVILQACSRRYAYPHAKILIHHISKRQTSLDTLRSEPRRKRVLHEMEGQQAYLYDILRRKSKKTSTEIGKKCKLDVDMSAKEALAFGLIDEIVAPRQDEASMEKIVEG